MILSIRQGNEKGGVREVFFTRPKKKLNKRFRVGLSEGKLKQKLRREKRRFKRVNL